MKKSDIVAGYHESFPLAWMRADGGTQARVELDAELVDTYVNAMKGGDVFTPVDLWWDSRQGWIGDGHHRYWGAKRANLDALPAIVRVGSQRDAILYACGANAGGRERTGDDKAKAIATLLLDPEWTAWSDREVARTCRVGRELVAKVRAHLAGQGQIAEVTKRKASRAGAEIATETAGIAEANRSRPAPPRSSPRVVREGAQEEAPEDVPEVRQDLGDADDDIPGPGATSSPTTPAREDRFGEPGDATTMDEAREQIRAAAEARVDRAALAYLARYANLQVRAPPPSGEMLAALDPDAAAFETAEQVPCPLCDGRGTVTRRTLGRTA